MPQFSDTYMFASWFRDVALRVKTTNFGVSPAQLMKAFVWLSWREYYKQRKFNVITDYITVKIVGLNSIGH